MHTYILTSIQHRVTIEVELPYTAAQFDADRQAAYKRAVGRMAATHADNVDIAFAAQVSSRRRLVGDDDVAGLPCMCLLYVSALYVCRRGACWAMMTWQVCLVCVCLTCLPYMSVVAALAGR